MFCIIKKLDQYILKKFLLIFVGAFFICLFVFMMQFTWRYVDELIGKGLSLEILAQFFWYMGITLVPQALPLAVLLAALIAFGNMGESLELLAMKAAGIPLIRIMRAPALVAATMMGVSFYFQNFTSPEAQIQLKTLLFSMKQQSPAVEIPEGVFYSGVPNVNIFVQEKNTETGMLYQTIIYKTDQGFDRAQIVLADSARLEMSADKMHLVLDLWDGEQFENLQRAGAMQELQSDAKEPFDRETFHYKRLIIDFDSNFSMMDKERLAGMAQAKNMKQIEQCVDSMNHLLDSIGRDHSAAEQRTIFRLLPLSKADSLKLHRLLAAAGTKASAAGSKAANSKAGLKGGPEKLVSFDSIKVSLDAAAMSDAMNAVRQTVSTRISDLEWSSQYTHDCERYIRTHFVEWHQKITLALACLVFFFVGAPLGAIIRKGGLGMPTIISVIIFIFWYIINTSGMKLARDGNINMAFGMWVSTLIIAPFGFWVTYKSNKDSVVFNVDLYTNFFRRLLGIRVRRRLYKKEVVIHEPCLADMPDRITALRDSLRDYSQRHHLLFMPGYVRLFFRYEEDHDIERLNETMEQVIEELSNCRDPKVLGVLNEFPILYTTAHLSPFHSRRSNLLAGLCFPLGLVVWFRVWQFRLRLLSDLRITVRTCDRLLAILNHTTQDETSGSGEEIEEKRMSKTRRRRRRIVKVLLLLIIVSLLGRVVYDSVERYRAKARAEQLEQQRNSASEQDNRTAKPLPAEAKPLPVEAKPLPAEAKPLPVRHKQGGAQATPAREISTPPTLKKEGPGRTSVASDAKKVLDR